MSTNSAIGERHILPKHTNITFIIIVLTFYIKSCLSFFPYACDYNTNNKNYNALRSKLDGVSNTVLSSALRELERDGLVTRQEYLEVPVRVEYSPTDSCRELLPILEQLSDWAEKRM